ncbi:PKD repeat protein [Kitasatospora sp. MAP12-15]|uniref:right-handed parallel beta-helix repeat-containing protein n=1 Tax=unclassified Kitasatospora TaxID=2633591 RepID=UPI002473C9CC|nr:right-handed parallel beta-helix repeat-containing protein [Kitasatospora sp. MAP12-44]MDH6111612.1 PKD repeat protein [Kitasatospora sp. MAP12-44]
MPFWYPGRGGRAGLRILACAALVDRTSSRFGGTTSAFLVLGGSIVPVRRHVGLAAAIVSSAILGSALPAFVAQADPTTLYVNNGSAAGCWNGGPGTQAEPFCTVQEAANAAQPGQTVLIAPNTYYSEQVTVTHSGTPGHPITFQGSPNETVRPGTIGVNPYGGITELTRLHAFVFSGVHDVTVTGLDLQAPQEAVLVSDSDRITVDGNGLAAVGDGLAPYPPGIRLTGRTTASTVSRNSMNLAGSGVVVDAGVTGTVVTTNRIESGDVPPGSGESAGVTVTDAPGTVVTSNSFSAICGTAVVLAGSSANSTIENNIAVPLFTPCLAQPDLAVSASSVTGTRVDYNVVFQAPGKVDYAWGDATYTSPAAFAAATGQGNHDIASAKRNYAGAVPAATDSADATAPGELATDINGHPRVDDPLVANTGTGVGYYDRGATEFQNPLGASVNPTSTQVVGHPLDADLAVWVGNGWGPVTGTLDFGDGSPKVTPAIGSSQLTHTFPGPGTYTLSVTVTDGLITRTATSAVMIQPVGPITPAVSASQTDWSVPTETLSESAGSPWPVAKSVLDFGDGSPQAVNSGPLSLAPFTHTYPGPGTYTATLTVTDDHGRSATTKQAVPVGVLLPLNRTIETVQNGQLTEIYNDNLGWHTNAITTFNFPISASTLDFAYTPSGARVIEAVDYGVLNELYSAPDGWHDAMVPGVGANVSALSFSFSPSGGRVIEAIEGGVLHEIYSAPGGWHDGAIQGVASNATALSFSFSPSGGRVIEAIEGGVLHEIYSAPDGWHDNAIQGVASNATAMSFAYNASGQRVIEAVEGGVLHEIHSAADGWHDAVVPGAGTGIKSLSVKIRPTGDRVIEAVENNTLHEIYTNAGTWYDSPTPITEGNPTSVSLALH